jgi:EAL domain-containing protein (putative c-di-GMP-specific phosphodiesterase class I)/GGDEF domain-containing protein
LLNAPKLTMPEVPPLPTSVEAIIDQQLITSHFQPIVDLFSGQVLAWEVLSRGPHWLSGPTEMFTASEEIGRSVDLELSCRKVALRTIAALPPLARQRRYFVNVSPEVFIDPTLMDGFMKADFEAHGLDQHNFVIEITEKESIVDYDAFERQIRHYVDWGVQIALDDFGAGHSWLVTLVTCSPHYMKMDMSLCRDIHHRVYNQHLVKSLVAFAASVDAKLIAEGVETWEELETLARLGVRLAQGFLFARPNPSPLELDTEMRRELMRIMRQFNYREADLDETVAPLVISCPTLKGKEKRGEEIERLFRKNLSLDHFVVLRDEQPIGLITRQAYYAKTGGPVGYHLFQRKPAEESAKPLPLIVEDSMSVTTLAKLAMEREPLDIYDPVLVINEHGRFIGSVTIRQLMMRSTALEVRSAQGSNPLTGLPGNRSIERWILDALETQESAVIYADLDRFKEYNDCYGFLHGDEMIQCVARVLSRTLCLFGDDTRLGHIGGDDFVLVSTQTPLTTTLQRICDLFDAERLRLFSPEDIVRGYFVAKDRKGRERHIPLVTLSIAVVPRACAMGAEHPGAIAQTAASLKRKVKELTSSTGQSGFLYERRRPKTEV